jgi:hypothetical protein
VTTVHAARAWERYLDLAGSRAVRGARLLRDLMAFALISISVMLTRFGVARRSCR